MANRRKKQDTSVLVPRSYASHPTRPATNPNYRYMLRRDMKDRLNLQRSIDKIEKSIKASNASLAKAKSSVRKLAKEFKAGLENDYRPLHSTSVPNPFSQYGVITDGSKHRTRRKTNSEPTYVQVNPNIPRMDPVSVDPRFTRDVPRDMAQVPPRHMYPQDELDHRMRSTGFYPSNSNEGFKSNQYNAPDRMRQAAMGGSRPYEPDFHRYNSYNPDYSGIPRNYRPEYVDHPREYRPDYIDHPRREIPEYPKTSMRDIPDYAKTSLREPPEYVSSSMRFVPDYSNTSMRDVPDYAKTSIRDIPEYETFADMPEYVRTIRRGIPDYIEGSMEFRPDYIESSKEFRPDYIEKSRSFIPDYDESSIKFMPDYTGSSKKADYLGSSVKADFVENSRSFIPEHPGTSLKTMDYVGTSNKAVPEYEGTFRQFKPDYGRNPSEYERENSEKSSSLKFDDLADAPRTEYHASTPSIEIEEPKINFRTVEEVMKRMFRRTNNFFFDPKPAPPTQRTKPFAEDESQTEEFAKNELLKLNPSEICRNLMQNLEVLVSSAPKTAEYYARDKCSSSVAFPESVLPLVKGKYPMSESTNATNSEVGSEESDDYDDEDNYTFNLRVYLMNYHSNKYTRINNYKNYKYVSSLMAKEKKRNTDKGSENGKFNDINIDADNQDEQGRITNGIEIDKHTVNGINGTNGSKVTNGTNGTNGSKVSKLTNGTNGSKGFITSDADEKAKKAAIREYIQRHKHIFNGNSSRVLARDYIEQHKDQEEQNESNKRKRFTRFINSSVSPLDLQDLSLDTSPARPTFGQNLEENLYNISTSSAKRAIRKTNTSRKSINPYNTNDEFMLTDSEDYAFIETRFGRFLYSPKIHDDKYMYRFIVLPNDAQNAVDMLSRCSKTLGAGTYTYKRLLSESQILHDLGIRMSAGWNHYFYFKNGHRELILRKPI